MNKLERIHSIDVIRGFAILGIAFANILPLSTPILYDSFPSSLWTSSHDRLIEKLLFILAEGNFYSLFAMLFGFSFIIFMERSAAKGNNPYILFSKRQFILLGIGILHALFIWYGDILIVYALFGFLLLPLYKAPKWIISLMIAIVLLPNVVILYNLIGYNYDPAEYLDYNYIVSVIMNYQSGGTVGFLQNLYDWLNTYQPGNLPYLYMSIFPMFLIGVLIAKSKSILLNITKKHYVFWVVFGLVGLTIKLLPVVKPNSLLYLQAAESIGNPLMSLFYGLSILLMITKLKGSLSLIGNIGRTSMSNYLLQNIIGFVIFKVFHLYGTLPPTKLIIISFIVAVFQIWLSYIWLLLFKQGPIEFLWRRLTYIKIDTLRNKKSISSSSQ
ncbi:MULTISPECIES: DUF418 domain-containing protein [Niallia]|uniref:DUF418 domain-containing protein n=1 Tax=Niallia taxi TaxID=2499688 RepID=A0A437K7F4_9BACI|nr:MULTISPECIES: DUF418 domain-containing protein [Niallia]MDK8642474.1 DUF418 domain-containing protein [Niallia taxi]MED4040548.1 DUF418 domain-containing protein [Niallia taxi]MED4056988.1 DUF418 domain-containing protein [Niallia taxi]MED4121666.1 DUF418 domain-containing protein [Niallia taxi]RVT59504.1 DUF418 domain-containing protein [Niallia taxi]